MLDLPTAGRFESLDFQKKYPLLIFYNAQKYKEDVIPNNEKVVNIFRKYLMTILGFVS